MATEVKPYVPEAEWEEKLNNIKTKLLDVKSNFNNNKDIEAFQNEMTELIKIAGDLSDNHVTLSNSLDKITMSLVDFVVQRKEIEFIKLSTKNMVMIDMRTIKFYTYYLISIIPILLFLNIGNIFFNINENVIVSINLFISGAAIGMLISFCIITNLEYKRNLRNTNINHENILKNKQEVISSFVKYIEELEKTINTI